MSDRARLDDRIFALNRRLEEIASKVSELQNLRDRVTKAEGRISGAAGKTSHVNLKFAT
jgi:hypothetical protein